MVQHFRMYISVFFCSADNIEEIIICFYCHSDQHIFNDSAIIEKANILKSPCDSFFNNELSCLILDLFTLEFDASFSDVIDACQHIEHGRLTCTVGSDNTEYFTLINFEIHMINSGQSTEFYGQIFYIEKSHVRFPPFYS